MNRYEEKSEWLQRIAQKQILSFNEALIFLDVSKSFLYKLVSKRGINFTKPNGGKLYFKKSDLENWMLQSESKSVGVLEDEMLNYLKRV